MLVLFLAVRHEQILGCVCSLMGDGSIHSKCMYDTRVWLYGSCASSIHHAHAVAVVKHAWPSAAARVEKRYLLYRDGSFFD